MRHSYKTFRDQRVELDGNEFASCTFINCTLVFSASAPVTLVGSNFDDCSWTFEGAAANTVGFMRLLYHGGGKQLIEDTSTLSGAASSFPSSEINLAVPERPADPVLGRPMTGVTLAPARAQASRQVI
jgi:hypothetical protein